LQLLERCGKESDTAMRAQRFHRSGCLQCDVVIPFFTAEIAITGKNVDIAASVQNHTDTSQDWAGSKPTDCIACKTSPARLKILD